MKIRNGAWGRAFWGSPLIYEPLYINIYIYIIFLIPFYAFIYYSLLNLLEKLGDGVIRSVNTSFLFYFLDVRK